MTLDNSYGDPPRWMDEPWSGFRVPELDIPEGLEPPPQREIHDSIERAYINGIVAAFSGDCPAVSGAIARVIDADALVWMVNQPGDIWPIHALVRKDDRVYDAKGHRTEDDIREYLASVLECPVDDVDFERHIEEHDPESFEIPDETGIAQDIIDERLVPAIRDEADFYQVDWE